MSLRPIIPRSPAGRHGLHERRTRRLELEKGRGPVALTIKLVADDVPVWATTSSDAFQLPIEPDMDGLVLSGVRAQVSTVPGSTLTIQYTLLDTDGTSLGAMLSTALTIDSGERSSDTGTAAVIDTANDLVAQAQAIRFDVTPGSGAKGLAVYVELDIDYRDI